MISVGDKMRIATPTGTDFIGDIISVDSKTITVDTTVVGGSVPTVGEYLMYVKNNIAESYGTTGYYLEYHLELPVNLSNTFTEIYSIGSSLFKSYP